MFEITHQKLIKDDRKTFLLIIQHPILYFFLQQDQSSHLSTQNEFKKY